VTDGLDELLAAKRERGPVSVIGWSLGGVPAVDLARRRPDAVRSLITLGSPLAGHRRPPATIPTTSIYSRSDAIVSWRTSMLRATGSHENVEVRGSHVGLGHNPAVIVVVADRLAQRAGQWRPFSAPVWAGHWPRAAA
jgi:pimeloyl-ACP methyl ester carboxylesterase